jgi:hypothetical protein
LFWAIFIFGFSNNLYSQQDSLAPKPPPLDRIYLINGSFVEGRLKKMERAQFTFKADNIATVNIDKQNIATLVTPRNIMRVAMINGQVYYGRFEALPNNGTAFIRTEETDSSFAGGRALNLLDIETIRIDNPNFFKNVQGDISLGLSYNRSSTILRTNINSSLLYTHHGTSYGLTNNGINTLNDTTASWERFNASVYAIYLLQKKWRTAAVFGYQRMLELGIASRLLGITALGHPIINTQRLILIALSGIAINKEFRTDKSQSNYQLEIPLQMKFEVYKMNNSDFGIASTTTLFKGITVANRLRIDHSTELSLKVYKDLKVSLEFFANYDSKPYASDASHTDYGTVFGFGYSF